MTPIESVTLALEAAGDLVGAHREFSVQRHRIIEGSSELQGRELVKSAALGEALANALRERGVNDPTAGLTGEVAIAIFKISFDRWVSASEPGDMKTFIRDSFEQLRSITATP